MIGAHDSTAVQFVEISRAIKKCEFDKDRQHQRISTTKTERITAEYVSTFGHGEAVASARGQARWYKYEKDSIARCAMIKALACRRLTCHQSNIAENNNFEKPNPRIE